MTSGASNIVALDHLPTPKSERWKYTNLPAAVKGMDSGATAAAAVIARGPYVTALDDITTAFAEIPAGMKRYGDMALWNAASVRGGWVVDVPAGKAVDEAVEFIVNGAAGVSTSCILIRLGKGAELTVIERHEGAGKFWLNALMRIELADGAKLQHIRIQDHGADAVHTQNSHVQIGRDATYDAFTLTTGAQLSRNQIHAELQGAGGHCSLNGVNLLRGKQHGDTTITIEHQAPHCTSNQFYRSVLDGQARGVFQGKVHVHKEAQKTDGYQLSNALILSQTAEMDTKPELEIYADDVKCSHGATTGQLDDEALFYMCSRGIGREEARMLLIAAFVNEVAEKLGDEAVKKIVMDRVNSWLDK